MSHITISIVILPILISYQVTKSYELKIPFGKERRTNPIPTPYTQRPITTTGKSIASAVIRAPAR